MPLERVDHLAVDAQGRPVRRVTRYVERRAGVAVPVAVPLQAAPGAPGAAVAVSPVAEAPQSFPAADGPPAVDLEETETVKGLRATLAELQQRLDALGATPAPAPADDATVDALRDLADLHARLANTVKDLGGLLDGVERRIAAVESVLAALADAAADVAEREEPKP
jgi:hypothetical protein